MNEVKNVKKELSDISIITMAPGYVQWKISNGENVRISEGKKKSLVHFYRIHFLL